ncbi:unnamed protein product [Amoebophrya sp. A120]|nr:unnamed protein product [Amoebophrya sp. A120]|eukprot:GSA120T00023236001.1
MSSARLHGVRNTLCTRLRGAQQTIGRVCELQPGNNLAGVHLKKNPANKPTSSATAFTLRSYSSGPVGAALQYLGLQSAPTKESEEGAKFLEKNRKQPGVVRLPSGLQYKVLKAGAGKETPFWSTPCSCHYEGRLLDGTKFDSSYDRGQPTTFAPNQVIRGWTEAMQLMVEGDEWELYIPAELAYGRAGAGSAIPPDATLIFKMQIVRIMGPGKAKE